MATRYKVGDRVKVKGIIFPMGGHWPIRTTTGKVVSVHKPTKTKPFVDYWVKLDNKPKGFGYDPKGFGYNAGYCRASDMRKV